MEKRHFLIVALLLGILLLSTFQTRGQEDPTRLRVVVNLVQLNVAVTDNKGNYVTGLKPSDFVIAEDGIKQTIATFGEGNQAPRAISDIEHERRDPKEVEPNPDGLVEARAATAAELSDPLVGANVFVLFDTS